MAANCLPVKSAAKTATEDRAPFDRYPPVGYKWRALSATERDAMKGGGRYDRYNLRIASCTLAFGSPGVTDLTICSPGSSGHELATRTRNSWPFAFQP